MILDEIAAHAAKRVGEAKKRLGAEELRELALSLPAGGFRFESRLRGPGLSLVCELKKASPSKGLMDEAFDYRGIAADYEAAGADCLSCLTEPKWFMGSAVIFREVRRLVSLPLLRKDFTVDEYQLYEARLMGADAVLLVCALLDTRTLARYLEICDRLGLCALVETHEEAEIDSAASAGARIIGINNRDLRDFSVDRGRAARLRDRLPPAAASVAESGLSSPEDAAELRAAGFDAVLIGEALMRAADRKALLSEFRRATR